MKNQCLFFSSSGQTTVEYLLLMALTASIAFLLIKSPYGFGVLAQRQISNLRSILSNVIQDGSPTPGTPPSPQSPSHPSQPSRFKALHL